MKVHAIHDGRDVVLMIPNEVGGVTLMLPSDY